jgi:uncharacterized membrane protein YhaH (DUF805 family)
MNLLRAFFSFYGRSGRAEYTVALLSSLVLLVAGIFVIAAGSVSLHIPPVLASVTIVVWVVLVEWAILAVLAKRFQDIGRPGYYCVFHFIPLVGLLLMIGLMFIKGHPSETQYGAPPRFFSGR